jgi:hypothetical protein
MMIERRFGYSWPVGTTPFLLPGTLEVILDVVMEIFPFGICPQKRVPELFWDIKILPDLTIVELYFKGRILWVVATTPDPGRLDRLAMHQIILFISSYSK